MQADASIEQSHQAGVPLRCSSIPLTPHFAHTLYPGRTLSPPPALLLSASRYEGPLTPHGTLPAHAASDAAVQCHPGPPLEWAAHAAAAVAIGCRFVWLLLRFGPGQWKGNVMEGHGKLWFITGDR